jgi:hypothetical protein
MFVVTHALLPVLAAQCAQAVSLATRQRLLFTENRSLVAIGIAGAAPDLLSPHLSLAARYASWTHNVWFLLAIIPVIFLLARLFDPASRRLTCVSLWFSVTLHLATDACSNGINWLYPLRHEILGTPLIPYRLWLWSDLLFLILVPLAALALRQLHLRAADASPWS